VVRCLRELNYWRTQNPDKPALVGELCWEDMDGGNCGPINQDWVLVLK
jgi:hypothetical protein